LKTGNIQLIDTKIVTAVQALARHGSFQEAALAAGISPASFSRHINKAETYVGQALFERRRNGTQTTSAGQEFLRLLDTLDVANGIFEHRVEQLKSDGSPTLSIGCGPLTTHTLTTPLLEQLLQKMPELRVQVAVSANKEPLEALRYGVVDVAICDLTHTPDLNDLDIQVIQKKAVSFWARPQHPIHKEGKISLKDIFQQDVIAPRFHRHWRTAITEILGGDAAARQTVERLPKIECDDYALLFDMACRRDLICGAMRDAVAQHAELGLLKEIRTTEEMNWNICAARRKTVSFPALEAFWADLRKLSL
jgi:DNA-binding transcriptional LysR family regulator